MLDAINNFVSNGFNNITVTGGISISFVILITAFVIYVITKFIKAMLPTIMEYMERRNGKKTDIKLEETMKFYERLMNLTNEFAGKYITRADVDKSLNEIKRELEDVNKKLQKLQESQSVLTKQQDKNKKDISNLKNNPDV